MHRRFNNNNNANFDKQEIEEVMDGYTVKGSKLAEDKKDEIHNGRAES